MASCYLGGYLVAARYKVPKDPSIVGVHDEAEPIGCSRIVCSLCKAPVRQAPNVFPSKEPRSPEDIYEVEDWTKHRSLKPFEGGRLYVCRCAYYVEFSWHSLSDSDLSRFRDGYPQTWCCGGHPDPKPRKKASTKGRG